MRKHYDFPHAQPNLHARRLEQQVTIRLDRDTVAYFRTLAHESGVPYQTLINLCLRGCAARGKKPALTWLPQVRRRIA